MWYTYSLFSSSSKFLIDSFYYSYGAVGILKIIFLYAGYPTISAYINYSTALALPVIREVIIKLNNYNYCEALGTFSDEDM